MDDKNPLQFSLGHLFLNTFLSFLCFISLNFIFKSFNSFETTCTYKRRDLPESLIYKIILFTKDKININTLPTIITPYDAPENMDKNIPNNYKWIPIRNRIDPLIKNLKILPEDYKKTK